MKLFLDDIRDPENCVGYMHLRIGKDNPIYLEEWKTVRNYDDFVKAIKEEFPTHISFDRDLGQDIANYQVENGIYSKRKARANKKEVKSGEDCAKWLINYCVKNDTPLPICYIHSANPDGAKNIQYILTNDYKKLCE